MANVEVINSISSQEVTLSAVAAAEAQKEIRRAALYEVDTVTGARGDTPRGSKANVATDPLAASKPCGDGTPVSSGIFSGASAAYYYALFAAEAVKSLGEVQDAFNAQSVDAFEQLKSAWASFAQEDGDYLRKTGDSYLYSAIASLGSAALSGGIFAYGLGVNKGWYPGTENLEGKIDGYYQEQGVTSSEGTFSAKIGELESIEEEGTEMDNLASNSSKQTPNSEEPVVSPAAKDSVQFDEVDSTEDSPEGEAATAKKSLNNAEKAKTEADDTKVDPEKKSNYVKFLEAKMQQNVSQVQNLTALSQSLGQAGSGIGQGVGQMNAAGTKQEADQYDGTKTMDQQIFSVEDGAFNNSVQMLKEMVQSAASGITSLQAAAQRA